MKNEYNEVVKIFQKNEKSFNERKEKMNALSFTKINWSDSYLEFIPYESIINQLKSPKIFKNLIPLLKPIDSSRSITSGLSPNSFGIKGASY